jgi:hypothetical protein
LQGFDFGVVYAFGSPSFVWSWAMALLDHFRRRDVRDQAALGAFIDEQSYHLAQTSVRNYCRRRADGDPDALFACASFARALDRACWEAYPRVLAMVGTIVDAALRPYARDNVHSVMAALVATILDNFDRRLVPDAIGDGEWRAARADLDRSLSEISRRPLPTADAVVQDHACFYLAIMPLHPKLGADDFPALRDELRQSLQQIQESFAQRASRGSLVYELAACAPSFELGERHPVRRGNAYAACADAI